MLITIETIDGSKVELTSIDVVDLQATHDFMMQEDDHLSVLPISSMAKA